MQGKLYLNIREGRQLRNGAYSLVCELTGNGKQKMFSLKMSFFKEEWNFQKEEPRNDKRKLLLIRKKKSLLDSLLLKSLDDPMVNFEFVRSRMLGEINDDGRSSVSAIKEKSDFLKFGYQLAEEKRQLVNSKGVQKEGNSKVYINALNQFEKFVPKLDINELDYALLVRFKNSQLQLGNKKSTVNTYLRTLRAVYNEGKRRFNIRVENNPFEGIFKDVSIKQNRTKKRNISRETLKILEGFEGGLVKGQQVAVDLFLLQFYCGGQDLTDIYYLEKNQLSDNKRVYFMRGKLEDGGYQFDLRLYEKAQTIFSKYKNDSDDFVFSWRKDFVGYTNFRNRMNRNLKIIQENYNSHVTRIENQLGGKYHRIEVLPLGGYITTKVARHTFATFGSRLYVDSDLLRTLMGHERDDVDTIYKDTYPEQDRDKCHHQIIDTDSVNTTELFVYHLEYVNNGLRSWKYRYFESVPSREELLDEYTRKSFTVPRYIKKICLVRASE